MATASPAEAGAPPHVTRGRALPYTVVETRDLSIGRLVARGKVVIQIPDDATPEETVGTLAKAIGEAFEAHPEWDAITLFSYSDRSEPEGVFNKGRATASRNGEGWDGEGTLVPYKDVGQIVIDVVTKGSYINGEFIPEEMGIADICNAVSRLWDLCQEKYPSLREIGS